MFERDLVGVRLLRTRERVRIDAVVAPPRVLEFVPVVRARLAEVTVHAAANVLRRGLRCERRGRVVLVFDLNQRSERRGVAVSAADHRIVVAAGRQRGVDARLQLVGLVRAGPGGNFLLVVPKARLNDEAVVYGPVIRGVERRHVHGIGHREVERGVTLPGEKSRCSAALRILYRRERIDLEKIRDRRTGEEQRRRRQKAAEVFVRIAVVHAERCGVVLADDLLEVRADAGVLRGTRDERVAESLARQAVAEERVVGIVEIVHDAVLRAVEARGQESAGPERARIAKLQEIEGGGFARR